MGGSMHLWNIGQLLPDYTVQHPRRQQSSKKDLNSEKIRSIIWIVLEITTCRSEGRTHRLSEGVGEQGPKKEEAAGGWRKLHSEDLQNVYSSSNIVRAIKWRWIRWVGHILGLLMRKLEMLTEFWRKDWREESTWGTRLRWEDNIKMDFKEERKTAFI
jgi:hypothetical protein